MLTALKQILNRHIVSETNTVLCQLYLDKKEKGKFAKADSDTAHLGVWLFWIIK